MKLTPSNKILLTGAGFTKNFGGFLAKDMWYEIFNHNAVGKEKRVKKLMQTNDDYDYETIYQTIMEGNEYTKGEKKAIHDAVMEAYKNLDYIVKEWHFTNNSPHPINIHLLSEMISKLADNNTQGYFFTLNQDLFIERKYLGRNQCSSLGIRWEPRFIKNNMRDLKLGEDEFFRLPNSDELNRKKEESLNGCKFLYIKLHDHTAG